jgi:carbon-monoxide dehydrogenase catalytic subunit
MHLILDCVRVGLSDGWGGSMYATDLSDVLFGEPVPLRSKVNLGVLDPEKVNVVVHGHEPTLSEAIVAASYDPEVLAEAKKVGAAGIQLSGICCTANEILMRHGIPLAGNFLHQELAVATGIADAMVVDIQCIFPGLVEMQKCFHTRMICTSPKAKFEGMEYMKFDEAKALDSAREILKGAIANFKNRDPVKINVPDVSNDLVAGFTVEGLSTHLGGRYRPSYRPLNNAIIDGRIRGVAGVIGCNTVKDVHDQAHLAMVRELIRHDVAVVQTGCSAIACAKYGLLQPEAAELWAGYGLKEVCDAVGIPPVLHMGSCVDNSRILMACVEMVREGGLGDDISMLPVAGAAPEWMSEKAISIGFYVVGSGIYTVLGDPLPIQGSAVVNKILTEDIEDYFGGKFAFEKDPIAAAHLMIRAIDGKREALGLKKMLNEPRPTQTLGKPMEAMATAGGA